MRRNHSKRSGRNKSRKAIEPKESRADLEWRLPGCGAWNKNFKLYNNFVKILFNKNLTRNLWGQYPKILELQKMGSIILARSIFSDTSIILNRFEVNDQQILRNCEFILLSGFYQIIWYRISQCGSINLIKFEWIWKTTVREHIVIKGDRFFFNISDTIGSRKISLGVLQFLTSQILCSLFVCPGNLKKAVRPEEVWVRFSTWAFFSSHFFYLFYQIHIRSWFRSPHTKCQPHNSLL